MGCYVDAYKFIDIFLESIKILNKYSPLENKIFFLFCFSFLFSLLSFLFFYFFFLFSSLLFVCLSPLFSFFLSLRTFCKKLTELILLTHGSCELQDSSHISFSSHLPLPPPHTHTHTPASPPIFLMQWWTGQCMEDCTASREQQPVMIFSTLSESFSHHPWF